MHQKSPELHHSMTQKSEICTNPRIRKLSTHHEKNNNDSEIHQLRHSIHQMKKKIHELNHLINLPSMSCVIQWIRNPRVASLNDAVIPELRHSMNQKSPSCVTRCIRNPRSAPIRASENYPHSTRRRRKKHRARALIAAHGFRAFTACRTHAHTTTVKGDKQKKKKTEKKKKDREKKGGKKLTNWESGPLSRLSRALGARLLHLRSLPG